MPQIFGIGIHLLFALFFVIHCVRTKQETFWIFILFCFPLLGSIAYFFIIYRHELIVDRTVHVATMGITKFLDPQKALREAKKHYEYTQTPENHLNLAEALWANGFCLEAAQIFIECLNDPYADKVRITYKIANSYFDAGRFDAALSYLRSIDADEAGDLGVDYAILAAKTLSVMGDVLSAEQVFTNGCTRYRSINIYVEFLIWAYTQRRLDLIRTLSYEVERMTTNWERAHHRNPHNKALMKRLQIAKQDYDNKR